MSSLTPDAPAVEQEGHVWACAHCGQSYGWRVERWLISDDGAVIGAVLRCEMCRQWFTDLIEPEAVVAMTTEEKEH